MKKTIAMYSDFRYENVIAPDRSLVYILLSITALVGNL